MGGVVGLGGLGGFGVARGVAFFVVGAAGVVFDAVGDVRDGVAGVVVRVVVGEAVLGRLVVVGGEVALEVVELGVVELEPVPELGPGLAVVATVPQAARTSAARAGTATRVTAVGEHGRKALRRMLIRRSAGSRGWPTVRPRRSPGS